MSESPARVANVKRFFVAGFMHAVKQGKREQDRYLIEDLHKLQADILHTGRRFPYIVMHTGTGETHFLIPADLQQPIYSYLWPEAVDWPEMFYN